VDYTKESAVILVTTAGKVGGEASRLLAERGEPVRVLVRDPAKAPVLQQAGIKVAVGDLAVPGTLDQALQDVTTVILVSPAVPAQEIAVIEAAARAGASHVVKVTSKASADSPIARRRGQAAIEAALTASGLGWTLLRNNGYMQNFLMMAPAIARTDSFAAATGDGRVGHIDARDVGAVAAAIAATPSSHAGRTYRPTGPEALSSAEVAVILSKVLGREITFRPITFEEQRQAMISAGLPGPVAEDNARALTLSAGGEADYVTTDVPDILGRPARSFEQFATEYATAFTA
jgi:uncharacterized protein YbjT (DUF2867 family)